MSRTRTTGASSSERCDVDVIVLERGKLPPVLLRDVPAGGSPLPTEVRPRTCGATSPRFRCPRETHVVAGVSQQPANGVCRGHGLGNPRP